MNTDRAMASLARANPVDPGSLATKGRSPGAQAALLRILAAPQSGAEAAERESAVSSSPTRRTRVLLATVALAAGALLVSEMPHGRVPTDSPGPEVAATTSPATADTAGQPWREHVPTVVTPPEDPFGSRLRSTTRVFPAPSSYALLPPGSKYLSAQIMRADIVVAGTITEVWPVPGAAEGAPEYITFRLEGVQTLLARTDSGSDAGTPAPGEAAPAEETLLVRAAAAGVEDVGHRGGLAPGDRVVFFGTRRSPTGETALPGFWLLLGDYSAYKEEDGVYVRVALVYDDPGGNSFTLPELETMVAPYGGASP